MTTTVLALLGTLCALSFGPLADMTIFGKTFFDFFDYLTSNIGMPIGVLGIALVTVYFAWPMTCKQLSLVRPVSPWLLTGYRLVGGVLAPLVIVIVTLKGLGLF